MSTLQGIITALAMNSVSKQLFAAEPFYVAADDPRSPVTPDDETFLLLDQFFLPEFFDLVLDEAIFLLGSDGQTYQLFDEYQQINEFEQFFLSRTLTDADLNLAGKLDNLPAITMSIDAPQDPVTSNYEYIFQGDDWLIGSAFDDVILGMSGNDLAQGNAGNDLIYGNQQNDVIYGNAGHDVLYAGQDFDQVFGGGDNDVIYGNFQDDLLHGNAGDDVLYGGQDQDQIFGDGGNDVLNGNTGHDALYGGDGSDQFRFANNSGNDTIVDFQDGADLIAISSNVNGSGIASAGAALAASSQSGDSVIVDLGAGNNITIAGFNIANLDESDFLIF